MMKLLAVAINHTHGICASVPFELADDVVDEGVLVRLAKIALEEGGCGGDEMLEHLLVVGTDSEGSPRVLLDDFFVSEEQSGLMN